MATRDQLEPFHWKPGQSGNPAGRPRRGLDAVQRLESLGVDPLAEVITLARDPELPKVARLKAWLTLCEYAYPRLAPVTPNVDSEGLVLDLTNPGVKEGKKILQAAAEGRLDFNRAMGLLKGLALVKHLEGDLPDEQAQLLALIKNNS
jgi:hypothetical protein